MQLGMVAAIVLNELALFAIPGHVYYLFYYIDSLKIFFLHILSL